MTKYFVRWRKNISFIPESDSSHYKIEIQDLKKLRERKNHSIKHLFLIAIKNFISFQKTKILK
jgi:hypothetical protein